MPTMPSASLRARVALDKHGFHTTHSLGQNFLLDERLLDGLLEHISLNSGENVLEIGPGAGVMTALIAQRGANITAVELDEKLRPVLGDVLSPWENAHVVFGDFLKLDTDALLRDCFGDGDYRVVANLPYYITADIMQRLITANRTPESIAIMVQKEAAQRLMSAPGQKQWCALAAMVQSYGTVEIVEEVPPECFEPAPHVMSAFLKITRHAVPVVTPVSESMYRRVITTAFAMRRKTLANNLKASFSMNNEQAAAALREAGLDERVRGEALSLEELSALSDVLSVR